MDFNPLPPHGGRHPIIPLFLHLSIFQSTPSAWRETSQVLGVDLSGDYFNPLPPHGGRPAKVPCFVLLHVISIHSLRMEGDTTGAMFPIAHHRISIHSLRMEGDMPQWNFTSDCTPFQSTPSAWRETARRA